MYDFPRCEWGYLSDNLSGGCLLNEVQSIAEAGHVTSLFLADEELLGPELRELRLS